MNDPDTFYWVLLGPTSRSKLTEFVKKGEISGQDLETCRTPKKGKPWKSSKIYFGKSIIIAKDHTMRLMHLSA